MRRWGMLSPTAALCAVFLALASSPSEARVPGQTARRRLEGRVSNSLSSPPARSAVAGLLVLRGGRAIISLGAQTPLVPASLTKLATTSAALIRFGADHRFVTRVVGKKPGRTGAIAGPITLVGGGDPTFATRAYVNEHYIPKPKDPAPVTLFHGSPATVEDLAAAVRGAGVRRVSGDLVVDESLFDAIRIPPSWLPEYQKIDSIEAGNVSAATINEGLADIKAHAVAPSPAFEAGRALGRALALEGVVVSGHVRIGKATPGATELARVSSPTLADIVFFTNRFSVNYAAEMLCKSLGAAFGGAGSTIAGVKVVYDTLAKAGIPLDGFHLADGSGLSPENTLTPMTIGAIIERALMEDDPASAVMRDSFPVAGGPGTLAKRMLLRPAVGNVRGKTGLLRHVRGMAGWVTATDGSTLVYVALFNNVPRPGLLTVPLDLIGLALARFPYL